MKQTHGLGKLFAKNRRDKDARHHGFLLAWISLAILLAIIVQPLNAAVFAGRYVYIVDGAVNEVEGFSINPANGALATLGACANVFPGGQPTSLSVDPTGSYLYVVDTLGNKIYGYTITPLTGCLAAIAASPWPTAGTGPQYLHITADGRFVYVTDIFGGKASVEGLQILPAGNLVPVPGGPFNYGVNQGGLAVDSVGPYLFAADDSAPVGPIAPLQYNAAGTPFLAPGCPGKCNTVTPNPFHLSATAAGQVLLVLSPPPALVDSYTINLQTGALVWVNNAPTLAGPQHVAADPFGRFAFVTDGGNSVSQYTLTPAGKIAANGAAVLIGAGTAPEGLKVDPTGKYVYIALNGTNQVAGYTINGVTGKLAKIAGSPWATFVPGSAPTAVATTP